jgi:hypothetical protein
VPFARVCSAQNLAFQENVHDSEERVRLTRFKLMHSLHHQGSICSAKMQCHFTCLYKASAAFSGCLFLCSFVPFKVEALKSQRLPPNISKEMIAAEGIGQRPFSAPKNGLPPWLPVLSFALAL